MLTDTSHARWTERFQHSKQPRQVLPPTEDYRRDRARIIHSASFRCLQSKTQVLGLGQSDFYRTRLTHSLEVAQIGSGICAHLRHSADNNPLYDWLADDLLIEAICLAHDLGHPPFGHGGETALNYVMRDSGGFEGNAQTFRILTELAEFSTTAGLNATRRTLLGVVKYPVFYGDVVNNTASRARDHKPPKCLYDSAKERFEWVIKPFSPADREQLLTLQAQASGHGRSRHKAFDTTIMELADDIAYGVHDFEDAVELGLFTATQWRELMLTQLRDNDHFRTALDPETWGQQAFAADARQRKHAISRLVGYFINHCQIQRQHTFEHPLLDLQAILPEPAQLALSLFKDTVMSEVILSPDLQAVQHKRQRFVIELYEELWQYADRLLPRPLLQTIEAADNGRRLLCDYVSGLSDESLQRWHHRLFSPDAL